MSFSLLMPAAGDGARLGVNLPKALVEIGGMPLFIHAALPFMDFLDCREVVIAAPPASVNRLQSLAEKYLAAKPVYIVAGGRARQESVRCALNAVREPVDVVLIHDAARPFVTHETITRVLEAMSDDCAAAAPALPMVDTLKRAGGDPVCVECTVDRRGLYGVQTPQAMRWATIQEAFRRLRGDPFEGTDDVSLVEHFDLGRIRLVEGDPRNTKITTAVDLEQARSRLAAAF